MLYEKEMCEMVLMFHDSGVGSVWMGVSALVTDKKSR